MRFIGREEELERLRQMVGEGCCVVVTGPPGVGKSRLAREVLPHARACTLVAARSKADVMKAICAALEADPREHLPLSAVVARALSSTDRTIVLDACDPAADAVRGLVSSWRASDPSVHFVLTARGTLDIDGVRELRLDALSPVHARELWSAAAVQHGFSSDSAIASDIVERLDRLPAAIEWFAARAALLGEAACLERLKDRRFVDDPLDAALDESLDALTEPENTALAAIVTFETGATVAALERFGGVDLKLVDLLTRRSLVRVEQMVGPTGRVAAYRPVVERMRVRMRGNGTWAGAVERHAQVTLELVEGPSVRNRTPSRDFRSETPREPQALVRSETPSRERAELEAVRERGREDSELAVRAALALLPLELAEGGARDARDRFAHMIAALPTSSPLVVRTRLALGRLERRLGDLDAARAHVDAALALGGEQRADGLIQRAHVDRQQSRLEDALVGYESALAEARSAGDREMECVGLGEVGRMLQSLGRLREAQARHVEAAALAHSLGLAHREALERSLHARATHRLGEVREAVGMHERALAMHLELGDRRLAAAERGHLGFCLHETGRLDEAEGFFRESVAGLASVGDVALEHIERVLLARLLSDRARHAEARLELGIARGLETGLDMPRLELTRRFVAGLVSLAEGRLEDAREHLRAGRALGTLVEVGFEALLPAHLALVEHRLGDPESAREDLEHGAPVLDRFEAPGPRAALDVLRAAIRGEPLPDLPDELLATSSDARRALAFVTPADERMLSVAADGRSFTLPDGTVVDLGRKSVPRRLLSALAASRRDAPGHVMSRDELIAAGWPGERMSPEAADKRLRTAIWTLRKSGLEGLLLTRDDGYLLDPHVPLRHGG